MIRTLESLIKTLDVVKIFGPQTIKINCLQSDSRLIKKDSLFVAIKGLRVDSHQLIGKVIKKGARVIVGEEKPKKQWLKQVTYVQVNNSKEALGIIASNWFGCPSQKMKIIGVTGTDGKTTTANLIYEIIKNSNQKVGVISTLGAKIDKDYYDTGCM